ncbi:MAG: amidohydrolase, partial [Bacteroidia bacterium]
MYDLKRNVSIRSIINATICIISIASCSKPRIEVDQIVSAPRVYICNETFETAEAFAITDGRVVAYGSKDEIHEKYTSENTLESEGTIFPGFIDAHSHFYGYGLTLNKVDLRNTVSMDNIIQRLQEYAQTNTEPWITGRGWDETNWEEKGLISNNMLNAYFPNTPVFIKRIDGHSGLANNKALELAGVTPTTTVEGGEIGTMGGRLNGLLMDNAMNLIDDIIPDPSRKTEISALLKAQKNCLKAGLTCVTDAGLDLNTILLIDSLQKTGDLSIRVYAMCNPNEENFNYFERNGPISTDLLQVSSFKIYADGSLGSRGAKLKSSYCDHENYTGIWVTEPSDIDQLCKRANNIGFQVNTHCIGDSANRRVLEIYSKYLKEKNDKRWRIEHAQVVSPVDRELFEKYSIIPSVQPTHATSDMVWAEKRLCGDRMTGAYAYKSLLALNGYIPLGTDFPVEEIAPLNTYFAAVHRQNHSYEPLEGFLMDEALSPSEAILGMTHWAARGNMMDDRIGSLDSGQLADFVILDQDIT